MFFFHHVGCDMILFVFWSSSAFFFFPHLIFFLCSNESVCITTGDEPGNVYGGGYEKHTACIYCTLWFGCAFPVFFFFFFFLFSFYRESPEKLWILFSDTVLSTRVVNISPAQKNTKQTICFVVSQQIKKKFFSSIFMCFVGSLIVVVWMICFTF